MVAGWRRNRGAWRRAGAVSGGQDLRGTRVTHSLSHMPLGYVVTVLTGVTMSGGRGA
jgi:hypothetical protein